MGGDFACPRNLQFKSLYFSLFASSRRLPQIGKKQYYFWYFLLISGKSTQLYLYNQIHNFHLRLNLWQKKGWFPTQTLYLFPPVDNQQVGMSDAKGINFGKPEKSWMFIQTIELYIEYLLSLLAARSSNELDLGSVFHKSVVMTSHKVNSWVMQGPLQSHL